MTMKNISINAEKYIALHLHLGTSFFTFVQNDIPYICFEKIEPDLLLGKFENEKTLFPNDKKSFETWLIENWDCYELEHQVIYDNYIVLSADEAYNDEVYINDFFEEIVNGNTYYILSY